MSRLSEFSGACCRWRPSRSGAQAKSCHGRGGHKLYNELRMNRPARTSRPAPSTGCSPGKGSAGEPSRPPKIRLAKRASWAAKKRCTKGLVVFSAACQQVYGLARCPLQDRRLKYFSQIMRPGDGATCGSGPSVIQRNGPAGRPGGDPWRRRRSATVGG